MSEQVIDIVQEFELPLPRLFAYLSEHENLVHLFSPVKVERIASGKDARNGVGSARKMRLPLAPPFVETVTTYVENRLIEYRITKGSPLKNHLGVMRFEATPRGSRLHYTIRFEGRVPLVAELVKPVLEHSIRKGLKNLRT